jgi:anti-sigma B factor antagonist
MDTFDVSADSDSGVLRLSGELDMAAVEDFLTAAGSAVDGQREVIVDLSQLRFIDSSGIRALIRFAHEVGDRGLVLRHPRPNVEKVLRLVDVDGRDSIRIDPAPPG